VTPHELLTAARQARIRLSEAPGAKLRVRGPLTPDLEAALVANKAQLLALLTTGDPVLERVCDVLDADSTRIERRPATPLGTSLPPSSNMRVTWMSVIAVLVLAQKAPAAQSRRRRAAGAGDRRIWNPDHHRPLIGSRTRATDVKAS
jgi:hypothetical protein